MDITAKKKYTIFDSILIPLKIAPIHTSVILIYRLVCSLIPMINVWVTANFINTAIKVVTDKADVSIIALPLLFVIMVIAWNIVSGACVNFVSVRLTIRLRRVLRNTFIQKRASLDYKYIEDQDTWDLITRVCTAPEDKFMAMLDESLGLISMIITTVSILSVLFSQIGTHEELLSRQGIYSHMWNEQAKFYV